MYPYAADSQVITYMYAVRTEGRKEPACGEHACLLTDGQSDKTLLSLVRVGLDAFRGDTVMAELLQHYHQHKTERN